MEKPAKISGVVITFNEEKNLATCLKSMQAVVDELIVVDSYSTDNTEAIARQYGAKFLQHTFDGHIEQKNYAAQQATYDFVLSLDADEALSDTLADSIQQAKQSWSKDVYWMNRLNNYAGTWIRYGQWYPDRKIRLFNRRKATWGGYNPHDRVVPMKDALEGRLKGDLLHYTYDPEDTVKVYTEHMAQINRFATTWAEEAYHRKKRVLTWWHLGLRPSFQFFYEFIWLRGFLHGHTGYALAKASAWHKYLKYLKLYAMYRDSKRN